jgi:hypothetical protein
MILSEWEIDQWGAKIFGPLFGKRKREKEDYKERKNERELRIECHCAGSCRSIECFLTVAASARTFYRRFLSSEQLPLFLLTFLHSKTGQKGKEPS